MSDYISYTEQIYPVNVLSRSHLIEIYLVHSLVTLKKQIFIRVKEMNERKEIL